MAISLLILEAEKTSVRSLYDDGLSIFPDEIPIGDVLDLSIGLVDRIGSPWTSRIFAPQSLASTTFRAALGEGLLAPIDGTTAATFTAGDSTTQTTADLDIFSLWATDIEAALNMLSKVVTAGGVEVSQPADNELFFVITFNEVGARNLLSFSTGNLVPSSLADVQRVTTGDGSTREVQTLRFVQNAGALNTISTAAASAAATLTNPQDGGGGANEQFRITLTGKIYKGSWTFSKTSGTTGTSAAILFDDSAAQIKAKLEATTGVGTGNVSVLQEDERTFLIEMIGSLANTAITATASGTNLTAVPELTGTLDLRTDAMAMLLNGSTERNVVLEIEKTVGANPPQKILSRSVRIVRPVIELAMSTPASRTMNNYFLSNITRLSGGLATDLDSLPTAGVALNTLFKVVIDGSESEWQLVAGTAATDTSIGVIRPTDYNASTNAKNLLRVIGL